MQNFLKLIEKGLDEILPTSSSVVVEAARYSLKSGGKRLRPLLTLTTAHTLSGEHEKALQPALAIELIHTYSLIHDDLPGMDNDDFRRGKPTVHKAYNEGQAILAGDFLLTYAFECLSKAPHLDPATKLELITLLAERSGAHGMIGGQSIDISTSSFTLDELNHLHLKKTGALIEAAILTGAICAKASQQHLQSLSRFAHNIGLAFQIVDDVIDVTHPEKKHGKSSDLANHKTTYVSLMGIDASKLKAGQLLQEALSELDRLPFPTQLLKDLAIKLVNREN